MPTFMSEAEKQKVALEREQALLSIQNSLKQLPSNTVLTNSLDRGILSVLVTYKKFPVGTDTFRIHINTLCPGELNALKGYAFTLTLIAQQS